MHRGVYSPSRRIRTQAGAFTAAVLAVGPDAVLARRASGAHWGIRPSSARRVEVIVPRSLPKGPRIGRIHAWLPADEITLKHGIPITSASRTILDLAGVLRAPDLEQAIERVEALRLWDAHAVSDLLRRYPGRR